MYESFLFKLPSCGQIGGPLQRYQARLLGGRFMRRRNWREVRIRIGLRRIIQLVQEFEIPAHTFAPSVR